MKPNPKTALSFFLWNVTGCAIGFGLRLLWISGEPWWIVAMAAGCVLPTAFAALVMLEEKWR